MPSLPELWPTRAKAPEPLIDPLPRTLLAAEANSLGSGARVHRQGSIEVLLLRGGQAPALLLEVGRVRELSFRAVGEGTGRRVDLDRFDDHYEHLVAWDAELREVVGAYRLGLVDRITARHGLSGLYTQTLFRLDPGFFRQIGPAIELGRSFVHPDHQRKPHSLALLWRGIGAYLDRHPECTALFGPVSISAAYPPQARRLMAGYFAASSAGDTLRPYVRGRRPFGGASGMAGIDIDEMDRMVRQTGGEVSERGIPVLLRQYLRLGGRVIACSVDPRFGGCLDGLIVVDLRQIDRQRLLRLLGRAPQRERVGPVEGLENAVPTALLGGEAGGVAHPRQI